jgi:predicted PurR-regulated permease PerM
MVEVVLQSEISLPALSLGIVLVETKLGAWVRGQVLLMAIIGILTYIGLSILRVDYALPLALLAGLLEVVPVVGPIFSAVPAVIIALSISPVFALIIAALTFLEFLIQHKFP